MVASISLTEFAASLSRCRPPVAWQRRLAVALSGGPDSLCLLFLLNRLISSRSAEATDLPAELHAIIIDHHLQQSSTRDALHVAKICQSWGVPHSTRQIRWGHWPTPSKPNPGESLEQAARDCRYHELHLAMQAVGAQQIAMGHHLDDQVETMILRFQRGTRTSGLAAMRPCRRWGMGSSSKPGDINSYGHSGMNSWIVRPLLPFPKDRILQTCREYNLPYLTDKTNFQPDLTPRNAIREELQSSASRERWGHIISAPPSAIIERGGSQDILYHRIAEWSSHRRAIDEEVDEVLQRIRMPSPVSTFCIGWPWKHHCKSSEVERETMKRILRYISPFPWGSPAAEAGRKLARIDQLRDSLSKSPFVGRPFTNGAMVLWTPVVITPDGLRYIQRNANQDGSTQFGWLATRLPPLKRSHDPTILDISSHVREGGSSYILWDNRFLLGILGDRVAKLRRALGGSLTGLYVEPRGREYLPQLFTKMDGVDIGDPQKKKLEGIVHQQFVRPISAL